MIVHYVVPYIQSFQLINTRTESSESRNKGVNY